MFVRVDAPTVTSTEEQVGVPADEPIEEPVEITTTPVGDGFADGSDQESTPETPMEKDEYSDSRHQSTAKTAFENYGEQLYPYGIKFHWFRGARITEYKGDGVWYFKVDVTITNQYDAKREAVAEGCVDFIKESVTGFDILDSWD